MADHKELFAEEASELFENAYHILLPAEESGYLHPDQIGELFRVMHTIKGTSGSIGLEKISEYTHHLESLLERVRDGEIDFDTDMISFLIDSLDQMQSILDDEIANILDQADFEKKIETLVSVASKFASPKTVEKKIDDDGFVLFDEEDFESEADDGFMLFDEQDFASVNEPVVEAKIEEKPLEKAISNSIRVDLSKIDRLLNRVGELVITNSMLGGFVAKLPSKLEQDEMNERLSQLERHIRDLQDSVMSVRMIPMSQVYMKLPKIVRDVSRKLGKKVRFVHSGDSVEIDKMMVEGLSDPLMHIIRNALDHGFETPKRREESSKNTTGTLSINANQENGQIVITISDDGSGIDPEIIIKKAVEKSLITLENSKLLSDDEKIEFIFHAGLSTAKSLSDISGRGVGMDVVRKNIESLGGIVRLRSRVGVGTKLTIVLPLTLAILDGLNVTVGKERYILPLSLVVESLQPEARQIKSTGDGSRLVLMLRDKFIPIIKLHELFGIEPNVKRLDQGILIVVRAGEERFALFVDEFGSQQQVVVKSLEKNYKRVRGVGGATVQGDGSISLILDPLGLIESAREKIARKEAS